MPVDPEPPDPFENRERGCTLHLSVSGEACAVDVRDRSGRQLQGFDGPAFGPVLREVREAGVTFDGEAARGIGRALAARRARA